MSGDGGAGPRLGVDPGKLKSASPSELLVRLAFGFGISLVAGLVTLRFGPRAGGLFLAFPAILPASLTLIEDKEGRRAARHDASGAVLGSAGMIAFAAGAYFALRALPGVLALWVALLAWGAVSLVLYVVSRRLLPEPGP